VNLSICSKCKKTVTAVHEERDGREYLVKQCPECGDTIELISNDAARYRKKRATMADRDYPGCMMNCTDCNHRLPNIVFIETTNRCNMNCPICITNVPSMGFEFEPDMDYFEKIFAHYSKFESPPSMQLFGGEPTMRDDIFDVIKLARSYGLSVRLVTNGLKLADREYCDRIMTSGASVLIAFDGLRREMYEVLRASAGALDLKLKALENLSRHKRGKVVLMTVIDKNMNGGDMPQFLDYCIKNSEILRGIFLMPLTQVWDEKRLDYEPDRTTQEDVEHIVDEAVGGGTDLVSLGSLEFANLARIFKVRHMPFLGVHPNCESFTLLVSDGKKYAPLSRYMKRSLFSLAAEVRKVDDRAAKLSKIKISALQKASLGFALARVFAAHINFGAVVGVSGIEAFGRWLGIIGAAMTGKRLKDVIKERTKIKSILQIILLPFEDDATVESERLEKCASCFAYIDSVTDSVKAIPFCIWEKFKNEKMKSMAVKYNKEGYDKGLSGRVGAGEKVEDNVK